MEKPEDLLPVEAIERRIVLIRGQKVMLDSALAELYQVPTKVLNQAVKRNLDRFPPDFMFRLAQEDLNQSHFVTGSQKHRDPRLLPYAFTEQGVAMLSSVLKSVRAVQVNIAIMRTFVRLRQLLETHRDLADKLQEIEAKYDQQFDVVFELLNQLTQPPSDEPKHPIGFVA
jgi:ORF6N domain